MLADVIDQVYKALEEGEEITLPETLVGRHFVKRLIEDYKQIRFMLKSYPLVKNKEEWVTSSPFPITIEVLNRQARPGSKVHVNLGFENLLITYYGICPELENYVTINLWPKKIKKTGRSSMAWSRIYDLISNDKDRNNVIRFGSGFGLEAPNCIHPGLSEGIDNIPKPAHVYDWEYVSFLKENGDTILSHASPLNFKKIYVDEYKTTRAYINLKSIAGRITSLKTKYIQIYAPTLYGRWKTFEAKIHPDLSRSINVTENEENSLHYFLICESMSENVDDIVMQMTPASPIDLVGHMLAFTFYLIRVGSSRLRIMSVEQYNELTAKCFSIIDNFCRRFEPQQYSPLWDPENLFKGFLSFNFRVIDDYIFAIPFNQFDLPNDILKILDWSLHCESESIGYTKKMMGNKTTKTTAHHDNIYDYIHFLSALRKFLIWNNERSDLYHKLCHDLDIRPSDRYSSSKEYQY